MQPYKIEKWGDGSFFKVTNTETKETAIISTKNAIERQNAFDQLKALNFDESDRGIIYDAVYEMSSSESMQPIAQSCSQSWEAAKEEAKRLYTQNGEINFPHLDNFDKDIFVAVGLQDKLRVSLIVPYTYQERETKETISTLKFVDEPNIRGASYDNSNALKKDFFEYSAKVDGIQHRIWSEQPIKEPEVRLQGSVIDFRDYKRIGDRATVPIAIPILIVKEIKRPQLQIDEIKHTCRKINSAADFIENYFGIFRHPPFFESLVSAWNLCSPQNYPLHLLWIDVKRDNEDIGGIGRSDLLERINLINANPRDIFDMSTSTSKGLTISFKREIAEAGYLLETEIALVDEFFTVVDKTQGRETTLSNFYNELNSILEWRKRLTKSGNTSYVNINPRCRAFFAGNSPRNAIDLEGVGDVVSVPFLERVLPYIETELHLAEIKPNRTKVDKAKTKNEHLKMNVPCSSWLKFVRNTPIDLSNYEKEINTIKEFGFGVTESDKTFHKILSDSRLYSIFERRASHHISCLIDGIGKLNHLKEINKQVEQFLQDSSDNHCFQIDLTENDMTMVQEIIKEILRSWMNT